MHRRTALDLNLHPYGTSVRGARLEFLPPRGPACRLLIVAGVHGEEQDGVVALSRACRSLLPGELGDDISLVFCANPDGTVLGTRGNANGVDLNRNFPVSNWSPDPSPCRWHADEAETIPISTGHSAGSEPETRALIDLIEQLEPAQVLTLHGPLACVDDPDESPLGRWIADRTGLPLVTEIGYPTPGSMGTWAAARGLPLITWEFPPDGVETLSRTMVPVLRDILSRNFPAGSGL